MARRFIPHSCASFLVSFVVVGLAACGSRSDSKAPNYEVRATVTGLLGNSAVLQLNGRGDTTVSRDGSVALTWAPTGFQYEVTVATPPTSPAEICTVSNGKGTVGQADVNDILVACSEQAFKVTVSVTGLKGTGLSLCDKANDPTCEKRVSVASDGVVTVTPILADAGYYALEIFSQPISPPQTCTASNWLGSVHAADVMISVLCTSLRITGKVTGSQVAGLQVGLTGEATATATTDSSGNYVFDGLANGSYTITPSLPTTSGWTGWAIVPGSVSVVVSGADAVAAPFRVIAPGCVAAWCATGPSESISSALGTVWGTGPDAVWVAGNSGVIVHWDGTAWTSENSGTTNTVLKVFGSAGEVYAVDTAGTILHRTGTSWTSLASGGTVHITRAAPIGPSDIWGLSGTRETGYTVLHWDGSSWESNLNISTDYEIFDPKITDLRAGDSSDVWVVGQDMTDGHGVFLRWNGSSWKPLKTRDVFEPYAVGGSGPSDVWAAGYQTNVVHWDGSSLSSQAISGSLLFALWSDGPTNAWGVGYRGLTIHWDGTSWTYPATGVITSLQGVWGDGPNDVWAVGQSGTILRWQQ